MRDYSNTMKSKDYSLCIDLIPQSPVISSPVFFSFVISVKS